jgi:predicted amidohydrolase
MKISLVQVRPVKGDIEANIVNHLRMIDLAYSAGADTVLFPELSLTGYEPTFAKELAVVPDDNRLTPLQTLSDTHRLTIGVGSPVKTESGITISLLLFHPGKERGLYSKQFLHPDEEPFFVSRQNKTILLNHQSHVALAICYELAVPAHAEMAYQAGAGIYLTSVAKSAQSVDKAAERLSQVAKEYAMTVGMVNCLGVNDGMDCGGRSSVWNRRGELIGQLDDSREGILLFDTETEAVREQYICTGNSEKYLQKCT